LQIPNVFPKPLPIDVSGWHRESPGLPISFDGKCAQPLGQIPDRALRILIANEDRQRLISNRARHTLDSLPIVPRSKNPNEILLPMLEPIEVDGLPKFAHRMREQYRRSSLSLLVVRV
jgi:hypothetical protein